MTAARSAPRLLAPLGPPASSPLEAIRSAPRERLPLAAPLQTPTHRPGGSGLPGRVRAGRLHLQARPHGQHLPPARPLPGSARSPAPERRGSLRVAPLRLHEGPPALLPSLRAAASALQAGVGAGRRPAGAVAWP